VDSGKPLLKLVPGGARGPIEDRMELKRDDWVKTESGEIGKVVHISRLTVFVAFPVTGKVDRIEAYLESQLTRSERPNYTQEGQG
jgi:hypothetical protein